MSNLYHMDLSYCRFSGPIPESIGNITAISIIDLSCNSIQGTIPPRLFNHPSLGGAGLDLSFNRLTGRIGKLNSTYLFDLDLSSNRLNIELESFYNHSNINYLKLSDNTVTEHGGDIINVTNFLHLLELEMSSCEIKEFPNFLRSNMPDFQAMDLSNNRIHGPIPIYLPETLLYLDLHSNSLRGTFPPFICKMSQLSILNLSHNKLSGNIPQ
ncbi:hypothetical protein ACS0TY_022294 [Phlomoides rotata]